MIIVGIIAVLIGLVVLLAVLRSQGASIATITIVAGMISLLAIFVIVVAGTTIYTFIKEGPRPPGMPYTHRCIVTVVQDGVPLEGATVTFHPTDQDLVKWGAISGVTNAKGNANMKVSSGSSDYIGVFQGEYKVTVQKMEQSDDRNIFGFYVVDQKYSALHTTPLELKVSRTTKTKVDLGPAVKIEQKSIEGIRAEAVKELLKVVYPCKITVFRDGKPMQDVEITLRSDDIRKYANLMMQFKGTTDANGVATIVPMPVAARMQDQTVSNIEGIPADTFQVYMMYKDEKMPNARFSRKLGDITISDKAFEQKYDLKDSPNRFPSF